MENRKNVLEIAYKFLETQKKSSLKNILNHVRKELKIEVDSVQDKKLIGNLYLGMISDKNFFVKDGFWYPRSQVTLEEIKLSQANVVLDDTDEDLIEENADETASFLEDDDDDKIHIAEDNYGDGDEEDLDLNKRILQEEFQGG